ncbi:MAG: exodeoxyribonuclease VII small subunit [Rhodospirillales bacterium]|jgi:exodeoxyribonuclease VII small subunit|nr:exodeoxyribonuclease VII small subunit [Rhodospirillales bacterium]
MAEHGSGDDVSAMSFEDALAELEAIVRRLEEGSARLDEAISSYERGIILKRHCEAKLKEAQSRVEKIVVAPGGSVTAERIDFD